MLGTFIDTIIVCSITGFAIILSGEWVSGETGATLTSSAFAGTFSFGHVIVAIALAILLSPPFWGGVFIVKNVCNSYLVPKRLNRFALCGC